MKTFRQAQFEQMYANAQGQNIQGGAADHGESVARQRFMESPMGAYLLQMGGTAFEDAFRKQRSGGFAAKRGEALTDKDYQQFLRFNGVDMGGQNKIQSQTTTTYKPPGSGGSGAGSNPLAGMSQQEMNMLMMGSFNQAKEKTNKDNEDRYADILGRLEGRHSRAMEGVDKYGKSRIEDLDESFGDNFENVKATLASRGLGNSTILPAFQGRNERDKQKEVTRVEDALQNRKTALDAQLSGDVASFMERRTDKGPDMNQFLQLANMLGQSGMQPQGYQAPQGGAQTNGPVLVGGQAYTQQGTQSQMPDFSNGTSWAPPIKAPIFFGGAPGTQNPMAGHNFAQNLMGNMANQVRPKKQLQPFTFEEGHG